MDLNWTNPGPAEKAITAEFIQSKEAREIREIFPEPIPYDSEHSRFVASASAMGNQLQMSLESLESVLPAVIGFQTTIKTTSKGWDELCDKVLATQKDYNEQLRGPWHRLWYGIGDSSEVIKSWIEIIPSEYGLAVVKTGVAVLFKLAEHSVAKRKSILRSFEEIQKAMLAAHPLKGSFRSHSDVSASLDELYQAIVDSINDLIILTSKENSSWRELRKRFTQRTKKRDVDSVLQLLSDKTEAFKAAKETARDQTIETIGHTTKYTALETTMVRREVSSLDSHVVSQTREIRAVNSSVRDQGEKIDRFGAMIEQVFARKDNAAKQQSAGTSGQPLDEWKATIMNDIMDAILEAKRSVDIQESVGRGARPAPMRRRRRRRSAVINEQQFCEALADLCVEGNVLANIENFLALPDTDWNTVGMYRGEFGTKSQSQVQSLLQRSRFLSWMRGSHPDIVLVNANLLDSGMENITAVSVFCTTLITSLISIQPDNVVLHFFCGLHVNVEDPCPGPTGLVRMLIIQVFTYLRQWKLLDLDFLDDRNKVKDLENQDLQMLCETLWSLLWQFDSGTQIYCIIDSITLFDTEAMLPDLELILSYLQQIVDDDKLPAIFKVLMTSSVLCSMDLEHQPIFEDCSDRILILSADESISAEMDDEYGIKSHFLQQSTPTQPPVQRRTPAIVRRRRYDDDDDFC